MSTLRQRWFPVAVVLGSPFVLSPVSQAEESQELSEVTVEADRDSIFPLSIPGNATVIDEADIAASGARSLADLLSSRGGLRISSTSGNASSGTIQMRGFGENAASRVLIMVDGRPVNRPDMAAVSLLEFPLSGIGKVEIVRGAQTARFGDNAAAGVINLVMKKVPDGRAGAIEVAGGSDDTSLFRIGYGERSSGHGWRADLERNMTSGWHDHSASEADSAFFRYDRNLGENLSLDLGFGWLDEYVEYPGPLGEDRYRDDPRQSIYEEYGMADQYFSEQTKWTADASLLWDGGDAGSVNLPFSFSRRDLSWNMGPGSHTDNTLDAFTFRSVYTWTKGALKIEAGGSLRNDHLVLDKFAEIQRRNETADAELSRWIYGGFVSADWEAWKGWHFSGVARLEGSEVDARAASRIFPEDDSLNFERGGSDLDHAFQAGLRWEGDRGSAWLRYDRLYRLPSTDEIASYQGYPMTVPFNDQLKAETGNQIEVGGEVKWDRWRFRANLFAQWMDGEIAYDYIRNLNVNFADTERLGVETELAYEGEQWEAVLRYSRTSAEFQDGAYAGKSVYLVPENEFSALIGWRPFEGWLVQGEYQYAGSAFEGNDFTNERPKLSSYGVTNLMVRKSWTNGLSIYGRINNLTDERYATVKYSGVWYPAAGRQFQIGLRKEF